MSEKEASQSKQFDKMTKEPIGKLLLKLSIPTVLSMMVMNLYNIVDTAFVGTLGTSQSGATGIVFGFMAILQAFAFMCGQGAGSLMSRKLGEKDVVTANIYTSTGFYLSFGIGLVLGIGAIIFMDPLLKVLGSTVTIAPYARIYIFYIALAAPFFTSSFTMNNLLRYEGKAKLGTIGMLTGTVINVGLDAVLMFVFKLGIAGAGIATAAAQLVSFGILIIMFLRGKTQTRIRLTYFAKEWEMIWNVLAIGFPSLIRQSLSSVATMVLNYCAGIYGDAAVSAMSCVSRISFFPMAMAIGIGQGFQPISSFNFGAKRKDRVKEAFWISLWSEMVMLIILSVPMYIFSPNLIKWLRDDIDVIKIGTRALRLMCLSQVFVPLTMMVEMGFQCIGEKFLASFSSSLRSGILLIPTLIILKNVRGLAGVQEAQPLAFIFAFFVGLILSRRYLDKLK